MEKLILEIITNGETVKTELKESKDKLPKSLFQTVCSFLNRFGGIIILGVTDDRTVVGVNESAIEKLKKEFANNCNNPEIINPTIYLSLETVKINGKTLLYVNVPDLEEVYRYKGKIFDRNHEGDYDITNNTNLVTSMYFRKHRVHVEDNVHPTVNSLSDLRPELIDKIRKMAINKDINHPWKEMDDFAILKSIGVYKKDIISKEEGVTIAGILLFGTDTSIGNVLPHYRTDALLRIENTDRYDDRDDVRTNLIEAFERLMNFVQKHTSDIFYLENGKLRISPRNIIAKEVVSNILMHRNLADEYPC